MGRKEFVLVHISRVEPLLQDHLVREHVGDHPPRGTRHVDSLFAGSTRGSTDPPFFSLIDFGEDKNTIRSSRRISFIGKLFSPNMQDMQLVCEG